MSSNRELTNMKKAHLVLLLLPALVLSGCFKDKYIQKTIEKRIGESISFTSVLNPDHYISNKDDVLIVNNGQYEKTNPEKMAATFRLRPALNGNRGAVSFESYTTPGKYVRQKNGQVILQAEFSADKRFYDDASFIITKGPSRQRRDVAIRPFKGTDIFLVVQDGQIKIDRDNESKAFRNKASFNIVKPLMKK